MLLFLLMGLFIGCQSEQRLAPAENNLISKNDEDRPVDPQAYHFPKNVSFQLRSHINCRTPMLLIPLALLENDHANVALDQPVEITYPFDDMPALTGYQYVVRGYLWTIGAKGFLFAFLLLGSDGNIYYMDTPDQPFGLDRNIRFFQADVSDAWQKSFASCLEDKPWSGSLGIWRLPHGETRYHWRNPEEALPIVKEFCAKHPLASTSAEGQWKYIKLPSVKNQYCSQGKHKMPRFNAKEVLMLRPSGTEEMTNVKFPNGVNTNHIAGTWEEIDKLWKTGKYKILAYDMRSEETIEDPLLDNPWALCTYAAERGVPLVFLCGEDKDAPQYEGLPNGVGQFWQCPQCSHEQMEKP